jgi:CBS domain containing-hemolysin-like protein
MTAEYLKWAGLGLVFLAAFLFSLFHASLSAFSKIALSGFLEDKEKDYRQEILDSYDETKIAVETFRAIFIIAFLICLLALIPRWKLWPLWFFLISLGFFFIAFDVLPRLLNFLNKKAVIQFFLPFFKTVHGLAAPLIFFVRKLEREESGGEVREASEEEIETFIDEAREEGIIGEHEGGLLKSVVEFGDTLVREIMTPRVNMICIKKDATFGALRELIMSEKYSRIPVYKDRIDNIEGIVIAKDLLQYSEDKHRSLPIEPIIRPVHFIPESMKVAELLKEFKKRKQKMAVVVDEHGGVSGLVTMEDLVEEIVGEIHDEYDVDEETPITAIGPSEYAVCGDAEVEKLGDLLDLDLAADNYVTVSGLIMQNLGRLPKRGEKFEIKGLAFEVLDVDQKRIKKLKVKKMAAEKEGKENNSQ